MKENAQGIIIILSRRLHPHFALPPSASSRPFSSVTQPAASILIARYTGTSVSLSF